MVIKILKFGISVVLLLGLLFIGLGYQFSDFYNDCSDIAEGMTKEEVQARMAEHVEGKNNEYFEEGAGKYGWLQRLDYDEMIIFVTDRWFAKRSWNCKVLLQNGVVISTEKIFE